MRSLTVLRFGVALGLASALSYVGCVLLMMTLPKEATISFFNSIMHGIDITTIMRWEVPWWETIVGLLEIFILGCLFGAIMAAFYNVGLASKKDA